MILKLLRGAAACMIVFSLITPVFANGSIFLNTNPEKVQVYQVGKTEGNGFRLMEVCGGGYLTFDDTLSQELAIWLCGHILDMQAIEINQAENKFTDLEEGLYLVRSVEQNDFVPFLVIIPWDGYYWDVEISPYDSEVPETGDHMAEMILLMAISGAAISFLQRRRKMC